MRAYGRESHDHELSLAGRFRELMFVVRAHDPDTVPRAPFPRSGAIQASVRCAKIQEEGHFGGGDVMFQNLRAKAARACEVAVDIRAQSGIGKPLRCPPLAQFGSVFGGFHAPLLDLTVSQKSCDVEAQL